MYIFWYVLGLIPSRVSREYFNRSDFGQIFEGVLSDKIFLWMSWVITENISKKKVFYEKQKNGTEFKEI